MGEYEKKIGEYEKLIYDNMADIQIFHSLDDREYWDGLKDVMYESLLKEKEYFDNYTFEPLYASMYMEFVTIGNRTNYEAKQFERRRALNVYAFLEAIENEGKHMMKILDLVWMTLEETQWALPAHAKMRAGADALTWYKNPTVCLFSASLAYQLAFVYFLFKDKFDELSHHIAPRIKEEVLDRVVYEYLENDYGYTGLMPTARGTNNWTSAVNVGVLGAAITLIDDKSKLAKLAAKVMASTMQQLSNYPEDGACDEGPAYWQGAIGDLALILKYLKELTNGAVDYVNSEKNWNLANYFTVMYIYGSYVVPFADSDAVKSALSGYIYQTGKILNNPRLVSIVSDAYKSAEKPIEFITTLNTKDTIAQAECLAALSKNTQIPPYTPACGNFLESIQVMSAHQTSKAKEGLFLAAKGGNNGEYHNHNDVGTFIVYKNGERFICDSGRAAYQAVTFGENRYQLWQCRSMYHNLPIINGCEEQAKPYSKEFSAENVVYEVDGSCVKFALDINNCYINKEDINKWRRSFVFDRDKGEIAVTEDYDLKKCESIVLTYLSAAPFTVEADGILMTAKNGETLKMYMDTSLFDIETEDILIDDEVLKYSWEGYLYHIRLKLKDVKEKGTISYVIK